MKTKAIALAICALACVPAAFADEPPAPVSCLTVHPQIDPQTAPINQAAESVAKVKPKRHSIVQKIEIYHRQWPKRHPVAHRRLDKTFAFTNKWVSPSLNFAGAILQVVHYL